MIQLFLREENDDKVPECCLGPSVNDSHWQVPTYTRVSWSPPTVPPTVEHVKVCVYSLIWIHTQHKNIYHILMNCLLERYMTKPMTGSPTFKGAQMSKSWLTVLDPNIFKLKKTRPSVIQIFKGFDLTLRFLTEVLSFSIYFKCWNFPWDFRKIS